MKGVELPINILVVIAVAVIVLLGVIALYFGGFVKPAELINQEAAKSKYCALVMRDPAGCTTVDTSAIGITDFDANGDGTCCDASDTLQALCETFYNVGAGDMAGCRRTCGCAA